MTGKANAQIRVSQFRRARRDRRRVVLEGFHAVKHAFRFGAEVEEVVATSLELVEELTLELAPDIRAALLDMVEEIPESLFRDLTPHAPPTGVVAVARRPVIELATVLERPGPQPIVLLEDPRNMGNTGAAVRVSAAANAAGVLSMGTNDPWHPDAVRGAAGLHFALPVLQVDGWLESDRPLLAVDPEGTVMVPDELPPRAVLAFGTERHGLSEDLLARADGRLRIPMRSGVSSLNLATSVAAVLFGWRFSSGKLG